MKIIFTLLALLFANITFAQKATINFNIKNAASLQYSVFYQTSRFTDKREPVLLNLDEKGHSMFITDLVRSELISFSCYDTKDKHGFNYTFILSPGDQLVFEADLLTDKTRVIGKGSNNNQPLPDNLVYANTQSFEGDTIPNRVINGILQQEKVLRTSLEKYISAHKPSAQFVKLVRSNVDYWALNAYFSFKENNKYDTREAYIRNFSKWQAIQDSLLKVHPLDNPQALFAPTYNDFITDFLLREKERLWDQEQTDKTAFYKEWYGGDEVNGRKEYIADVSNGFREKIVDKYFKGKTAEFLYAHLITDAVDESNPKSLSDIYARFKLKYPKTPYTHLENLMHKVQKREKQHLSKTMVFADSTGTKLNTFSDLLNVAKNKTVLVDMWGTWCSPCREEIEAHSLEIKKHFKDKDLEFFYVANYDTQNIEGWKKLIAYFNLEGTHILANQKLTEDIMTTVKGQGYPTYFIIKKDGSFELGKAGYPMNRKKMIEQLEASMM